MYQDILVPTDGSDASTAAIDHAVSLAATYDAHIHALYVVEQGVYAPLDLETAMIEEALETEGEAAVAAVADAAEDAGVEVQTGVVEGDVRDTILDYAEANDVDLIVIGTHGRRGVDRYLLGSVTEQVVRSSPVPVLTVRAADS
ncbi:MAG: universal stress protein [Haloplanus sp.]